MGDRADWGKTELQREVASSESLAGPIDCLLYCHDGKGLGHVSRTVAVSLALKRLSPACRVAIATGAPEVAELSGGVKLPWIHLPPYAALNDEPPQIAMGKRRSQILDAAIRRLSPSLVVVDQLFRGEQDELDAAIQNGVSQGTKFVLGVRGIVGDSSIFWSREAGRFVNQFYDAILWYGSGDYYGSDLKSRLAGHFGMQPFETGIISRALELSHHRQIRPTGDSGDHGVITLSWARRQSLEFLGHLLAAVPQVPSVKQWHLFLGPVRDGTNVGSIRQACAENPGVQVHRFSVENLGLLRSARLALTYAGYNSVSDLLWAGVPGILVMREGDLEQRLNAETACHASTGSIACISEEAASTTALLALLVQQLPARRPDVEPPGGHRRHAV